MAEEVKVNLKAEFGSLRRDLQDVTTELADIKDESKKASKGLGGIKKAVTGVGAVLTGGLFKAGAVIFEKLMELFMGNQRVMDAMAVGANMLQKAFNDLVGFVTDFSLPTFTELKDIVIQGTIDRFNELMEVFGLVGKAFMKLVKGDFSGAFDSIKQAGKESIDVFTGVDKSAEKVTKAVKEYATETFNAAKNQVDLNKQAQLAEAINAKLLLQYSRDAELQRQLRDDTTASIDDRIAANEELGRILDEQSEVMMANAQDQVSAAQAALDLDKQNLDLQIALINAQTALIDVEETVTGFRSEQLTNTNSLLQEQKDLLEETGELIVDNIETEKDAGADSVEIAKMTNDQKVDLASNAMGDLANVLGEESKAGKAAAIAQTTIETYKGATAAYASLAGVPIVGPVLGAAAAAAAIAAGIANVKAINSTGPSVSSGSTPNNNAPASAPPDFNIVGTSPINQLAETIGGENQKPIKAFVTSSDVSTAQSLDRNIIESASIG